MISSFYEAADKISTEHIEAVLCRELTENERRLVMLGLDALIQHVVVVPIPSFDEVA